MPSISRQNKKRRLKRIILIAGIILLIFFAGFAIFYNFYKLNEISCLKIQNHSESVFSDKHNIYRNTLHQYEIQYPTDWRVAGCYMLAVNPGFLKYSDAKAELVVLTSVSEEEERSFLKKVRMQDVYYGKFAPGRSIFIRPVTSGIEEIERISNKVNLKDFILKDGRRVLQYQFILNSPEFVTPEKTIMFDHEVREVVFIPHGGPLKIGEDPIKGFEISIISNNEYFSEELFHEITSTFRLFTDQAD